MNEAATRRRAVSGFSLYDAANSAFVTVVITALGGPFVTSLVGAAEDASGRVSLLGLTPRGDSVYAYALSFSIVLQVLAMPVLGALADRVGSKRLVLVAATTAGSVLTVALAFVPRGQVLLPFALLVAANAVFGVAIMSYNAYLADVSTLRDRDAVSARGYAVGYAGGAAVLVVALALIGLKDTVGLTTSGAGRVSIAIAGVWWLTLGLVAVRRLDAAADLPGRPAPALEPPLAHLKASIALLRSLPQTARYLVAFLLFNDAIQAVIGLSAVYLTFQLYEAQGRDPDDATGFLLTLVLLIQVVAVAGALGCARLARRYGPKNVLLGTLIVWAAILFYAVTLLDSQAQAYGLGVAIALVLGGSQALARSLFSAMVPHDRQASFFAFFVLAERGTAFVGPLIFAVTLDATGDYDVALLSILVLFVAGGLLLARTDTGEAVRAAERVPGRP